MADTVARVTHFLGLFASHLWRYTRVLRWEKEVKYEAAIAVWCVVRPSNECFPQEHVVLINTNEDAAALIHIYQAFNTCRAAQ